MFLQLDVLSRNPQSDPTPSPSSGREAALHLSLTPCSSSGKVSGIHFLSTLPNIRETVQGDPGSSRSAPKQSEGEKKRNPSFMFCLYLKRNRHDSLGFAERSGAGRGSCAEKQYEKAAHHPDRSLAGGVPLHAGLHWSSAALLQIRFGHAAPLLQVCRSQRKPLIIVVFLLSWGSGVCVYYCNVYFVH